MSRPASEAVPPSTPPPSPRGQKNERPLPWRFQPGPVDYSNRLSRTAGERLVFYFTTACSAFGVVGFLRARRLASHQFLAENSHRLPTSDAGWYLYHRAKNYRTAWKGIKGGARYGLLGGVTAYLYGFIEDFWDQDVRSGRVDAMGSFVAGTVTAAFFAMWKGLGPRTSRQYFRVGMGLGLVSGVLQDSVRWTRGATPWYIEELKGQQWGWTPGQLETRKA